MSFDGRLGIQQRILPGYRVDFFDTLGSKCSCGLSVFAGSPRSDEGVESGRELSNAQFAPANNLHILSGKAYIYYQAGILEWLRKWQPDVLITEINPRNLSNPAALRWMHSRGRPVIGWGLGVSSQRSINLAMIRRILRSLSAVIAYSEKGAQQYIQAGMDPQRVFVAANAVSPRPESPPLERPSEYRDGAPELLFVGRLQARKQVDTLLYSLAQLPVDLQPHLTIVGDGPDRPRLAGLAAQVYPNVTFAGAKHGSELEPYYRAADLFVLPGTGGLAIQQAMAHSLPVIVGQADGTQAELVRLENGWLLPDGSPQSLAGVLNTALSDLPGLRQKGLASYRIVREEVNLEAMVASFLGAIEFTLGH